MWYRPNKEEAKHLSKAGYLFPRLGFFILTKYFIKFLDEAERLHPEHTFAANSAWAAHSARTHNIALVVVFAVIRCVVIFISAWMIRLLLP